LYNCRPLGDVCFSTSNIGIAAALFSARNLPAAERQEDSRPAVTFHKTVLHKKVGINHRPEHFQSTFSA
jgi:hypothetical protein